MKQKKEDRRGKKRKKSPCVAFLSLFLGEDPLSL